MALIGVVYKWRLDCDSYVYITDFDGEQALIVTSTCIEEEKIKDIVSTWNADKYCDEFNKMVDYVHSFEKWKDLRFLDCNVYLKEYYGCEDMLKPAFPTGIELNLSATSVEYYAQPEATVLDVKCITRDGEKITSYDINFGIPRGIPGLTIKGSWTPSEVFSSPLIGNINDGYIIDRDATLSEFPKNAKRGDLWICTQNSDMLNGKTAVYEFSGTNLCGPAGEGSYRFNEEKQSYMFGDGDTASGLYSFTKGRLTVASGDRSTAEGFESNASGLSAHAEGQSTKASNVGSHAEGRNTEASGNASHAEGNYTKASGVHAHAEGYYTTASGDYSHAEGGGTSSKRNIASASYSHVEGYLTQATNDGAHAEGGGCYANGKYSHAEGFNTIAEGNYSHSEGVNCEAIGNYSHASGYGNIAVNPGQYVGGQYATIDDSGEYLFQIGVGNADDDREDAFIIKRDGTVIIYTLDN